MTDGDESMYQQAVDVPKQSEQEHYAFSHASSTSASLGLAKELELVDGSVLIDGRIVGEMFENIIPILRWCRRDALSDYLVKEFTPLRTDGSTTEKSIPSVSVLVDVEKLREMLSAIKKPIPQDIPRDQHINTLLCGIEDWLSSTLKDTQ